MRVFQHDAYISVDFQDGVLSVHRKGSGEMFPGIPDIESEQTRHEDGDALKTEIDHFLDAALHGREPLVTGEDGKRALEAAMCITELLSSQRPVSPAGSGSD
jgi:predicted dehydrogenase